MNTRIIKLMLFVSAMQITNQVISTKISFEELTFGERPLKEKKSNNNKKHPPHSKSFVPTGPIAIKIPLKKNKPEKTQSQPCTPTLSFNKIEPGEDSSEPTENLLQTIMLSQLSKKKIPNNE